MKKKFYTLIFLIFCSAASICQPQAYHWYFGNHGGLDFSSGSAVAVNNSAMSTDEGCSSISDASGNLLFYTNGADVYNFLHQLMPNGTGLLGHISSTQSSLIVQKPGTTDHFYIFTSDAGAYLDPPNIGVHFSEVDMNLNSGSGDVIAATKNTVLLNTAAEKLCATRHANGSDIWVLAHGWNDSTFYAYIVTSTGVNVIPDSSVIGSVHNGSDDNTIGQMKFSPQGDKLALAVRIAGFFELFDFNNATGAVSNSILLQIPQFLTAYGLEFSPDGSSLYVSTDSFNSLYQYDLSSGNPTAIINSLITVGTISGGAGSLQLAPDGKIYMAHYIGTNGNQYLGRINFPNILGNGCNFVNNAVNLGTGKSYFGLPNFISSYFLFTGISENKTLNYFSVYYDHLNNSLKINFDHVDRNSAIAIRLIDLNGKEILHETVVKVNSEIILNELKTGIYIFEAENREFNFNRKIFIYR
ncbi:MAG: T9SS type A sorting domain-containing protein [Bacteroidia bacterium]